MSGNPTTVPCAVCEKPATCWGRYEEARTFAAACDDCCGHGNEDGVCHPLAEALELSDRDERGVCLDCETSKTLPEWQDEGERWNCAECGEELIVVADEQFARLLLHRWARS